MFRITHIDRVCSRILAGYGRVVHVPPHHGYGITAVKSTSFRIREGVGKLSEHVRRAHPAAGTCSVVVAPERLERRHRGVELRLERHLLRRLRRWECSTHWSPGYI